MNDKGRKQSKYLTAGDYWILFAVYFLYAIYLLASINPYVGLRKALSYLGGLHFILCFGYLFFLDRHEEYFWKDLTLVRYGSYRASFSTRRQLLIWESLIFWTPFLILEIAGGILDRQNLLLTVGACLNYLLLVIILGYVACRLSEYWRGTHWGVLLLGAFLTIDYLQAYGWLLPFEASLFYWPCMNPFRTLTADTVFRGCTLSLLVLLFLFLSPREGCLHCGRPKAFGLAIPTRELLFGGGMGILLAISCVREAETSETLWLLSLGLGGRNNDLNLFGLIFDLMPFLLLFLSCGSGLSDQIKTAAVLVFPRAGSRIRWWNRWFWQLIRRVLAFFFSMLLCNLAGGLVFGILPANGFSLLITAASLMLCWSGLALILVLTMNIHGMQRDRREAFLLVSGVLSLGYLAISWGKVSGIGALIRRVFLPARGGLVIHGSSKVAIIRSELFARAIPDLSIWETGFIFLLCLAALYRIGLRRLQTMDYR